MIEVAALLAAGAAIGLLAGLHGIGGGVVAVPVLLEMLSGRPDAAGMAIGTTHAAVLVSALPAFVAHARAGGVDRRLVRGWLPAMLVGALLPG